MLRRLLTAVVPFLCFALSGPTQPAGVLCVDASPCVDAIASPAPVSPAEHERMFRWIDPAGSIVLGTIPPRGDRAVPAATEVVRVRLTSSAPSRWPAEVILTIRRGERTWRIPVTTAQVEKPIVLRVDAGTYALHAESAGHRRTEAQFTTSKPAVDVAVKLHPLPQMTARVVTRDREPIPGAIAARLSGEVIAVADGTGRLTFDVDPEQWPETIAISAAGFGTATVPIPRARVSADLFDVVLTSGSKLEVTLEQENGDTPVTLELYKRTYDVPDDTPIATKIVDAAESAATFADIAAGTYVLRARGSESTQRFGMKFSVRDGEEKKIVLPLRSSTLAIQTLLGEAPLASARVELFSLDGLWREAFRGDASGRVQLRLWQLGKISATVSAEPTLTVPFRASQTFASGEDADWTIRVSTRKVRGRIVDASSDAGVKEANVALQVKGQYSAIVTTDSDGRFVFTSVVPGQHTVSAAADGYQHDTVHYTFLESEEAHEVTVPLRPAAVARLTVRDASGAPIANALVLDFAGSALTGERVTGADGEVAIPVPPGETREVFVIPRDGSFAVGRIRAGKNALNVPPAAATIVVTSRTTAQQPIPQVWVALRYNGIAVPFEVQQALARQQGAVPVSGVDGRIILRQMPLGVYEMWPAGSAEEVRAVTAGLGPDAPVRIVARPGLNEAVLEFSPKK